MNIGSLPLWLSAKQMSVARLRKEKLYRKCITKRKSNNLTSQLEIIEYITLQNFAIYIEGEQAKGGVSELYRPCHFFFLSTSAAR